jgi:hypothetical protein
MKNFFKLLFTLAVYQSGVAQNANVILQVNEQVVSGTIGNMHMSFYIDDSVKNSVDYYPGELMIEPEIWDKINDSENEPFTLHFDYYTYEKGKQKIANFNIELTAKLLKQPYLIITVYDFRNKTYRERYSCLTDKEYLVQLTYPNSGIYITCN